VSPEVANPAIVKPLHHLGCIIGGLIVTYDNLIIIEGLL
jgi:hypothetical protein